MWKNLFILPRRPSPHLYVLRRYSTKDHDTALPHSEMLKDGETIPIRSSGKKSVDEDTRAWRATNTPDDESLKKVFKKDLKKDGSLRNLTASQNILKQANRLSGDEDEEDELSSLQNLTAPVTSEKERQQFINPHNAETGEKNGPKGPEPTRYGDWERSGRVYDF
jgi:hypothetical protein